jgi:hypothetical protein
MGAIRYLELSQARSCSVLKTSLSFPIQEPNIHKRLGCISLPCLHSNEIGGSTVKRKWDAGIQIVLLASSKLCVTDETTELTGPLCPPSLGFVCE